jgi:hypothetical protein
MEQLAGKHAVILETGARAAMLSVQRSVCCNCGVILVFLFVCKVGAC